jgi:hypothetical protein
MFVQVQSIVSSNIYRQDDIPDYSKSTIRLPMHKFSLTPTVITEKGNSALVAITVLNIFLYIAVKQYYIWRNNSKERQWKQLAAEERAVYLETTTTEGNKRLDFRFVH